MDQIYFQCHKPNTNNKSKINIDDIREWVKGSNGDRPFLQYFIVGKTNQDTSKRLVVSKAYHDSVFGSPTHTNIYSFQGESSNLNALLECEDGTTEYVIFSDLDPYHYNRFSHFSDIDKDGDFDLLLSGKGDLYDRVWLNDKNIRFNTEYKYIWKRNPVPALINVLPGALILWGVLSLFAFPYLFVTKLALSRRILVIVTSPVLIVLHYILGFELFGIIASAIYIILILFSICNNLNVILFPFIPHSFKRV